ncbi:cation:proton antiporter [Actinomadura rupiterrae]|uniref:cation:proton antiporter n=1 Tax=Actinomadura rupiterrae TaxID=559627 RepID=UPI0020A4EF84|nr:cation:proton antiporter [Actinomadura rupiterrae]MCP2339302.1 Kef-type K+ transport system membrane component KefB [Actinomadura rupiterrae]
MAAVEPLGRAGHVLAALGAVLLVAAAGRYAARRSRQPEVIGELAAGLLAGPAVLWLAGRHGLDMLLPRGVLAALKLVGEAGLVLFLCGLAHKLRTGPSAPDRRTVTRVVVGALLPAQAAGVLLAALVLATGDPAVRGTAPTGAFVLMLAVTLSITAVPVLARILLDRGLADTPVGRVSLASGIVIDALSWPLLTVAIGLASGSRSGFLRAMAVLACGLAVTVLLRRVLGGAAGDALCRRAPRLAAPLIGIVAVALACATERLGLTAIVGAALAGLAVPAAKPWSAALGSVTAAGRSLVPVYFVVSGVGAVTAGFAAASPALVLAAVALGVAGKTLGGYAGARLGAQSRWDALRVGALMNTRGLTELIVLQAGRSAGIITPALFAALVVMALATTAMTGPALALLDRAEMRHRPPPARRRPDAALPDGALPDAALSDGALPDGSLLDGHTTPE